MLAERLVTFWAWMAWKRLGSRRRVTYPHRTQQLVADVEERLGHCFVEERRAHDGLVDTSRSAALTIALPKFPVAAMTRSFISTKPSVVRP